MSTKQAVSRPSSSRLPFGRPSKRTLIVALAVAVLAAAVGTYFLVSSDDEVVDQRPNAAAALEGGPDEVLYLSGTALIRHNVETQEQELLENVKAEAVYAAPGSTWLATWTNEDIGPQLSLYDAAADERIDVGRGVTPAFDGTGQKVAYLNPADPSNCAGQDCPDGGELTVYDIATREKTTLLEAGRYTIHGWVGDHVVISDLDNPKFITAVPPEGPVVDENNWKIDSLSLAAASPDGEWLLMGTETGATLVPVEDGAIEGKKVRVDLGPGATILDAAWSHDSSQVAVIMELPSETLKGKGKNAKMIEGEPSTRVVTFSPTSTEPHLIEESFGATQDVFWTTNNEGVVFSSLIDPKKALFQATQCPVATEGECIPVTSWTEGVLILRAE